MCIENELGDSIVNSDTSSDDTEKSIVEYLNDPSCAKEILVTHTTMKGCSPCKNLGNAFDEMREEYEEVIFQGFRIEDKPGVKNFLMERGLFAHPSIVIITGEYIFWKMGAGSVEEEKAFWGSIFDTILEGEIEMNREERKVEILTEEFGKVSFEGQVKR